MTAAGPGDSGRRVMSEPRGRVAADLDLCRSCDQFVFPGPLLCVHCGADLAAAALRYEQRLDEARDAARDLEALVHRLRPAASARG